MKKNRLKNWSSPLTLIALLGLQACSGSSDGNNNGANSTTIDPSNPASMSATFNAIEGLLDGIQEEGSGSTTGKFASRQLGIQDILDAKFSTAGCRVKNDFERARARLKNDGSATLCRIKAVADATGAELGEEYTVFKITGVNMESKDDPQNQESGKTADLLVRVKTEGSKKLFFEMCEPKGEGAYVQRQSWYAEGTEKEDGTKGVSIKVQQNSEGEGRKSSLSLEAYGTTDELTKMVMNTRWDDQFGKGSVDASADRTEKLIYVDGSFENSFTMPGENGGSFSNNFEMCGYISKGRGAGKEKGTFTSPPFITPNQSESCGFNPQTNQEVLPVDGVCTQTFEHQEAFKILKLSLDDSETYEFCAVDEGETADALIAKLSACEIDENPVAPEEFSTTWDCSYDEASVKSIAFSDVTGFKDCEEDDEKEPVDCFREQRDAEEKKQR